MTQNLMKGCFILKRKKKLFHPEKYTDNFFQPSILIKISIPNCEA